MNRPLPIQSLDKPTLNRHRPPLTPTLIPTPMQNSHTASLAEVAVLHPTGFFGVLRPDAHFLLQLFGERDQAFGGEDRARAEGGGGLFPAFGAVAVEDFDGFVGGGFELDGAALAFHVHYGCFCYVIKLSGVVDVVDLAFACFF